MNLSFRTMIRNILLTSAILVLLMSVSVNAEASSITAADFWSNLDWVLSNVTPAESISLTEQTVFNNPFGNRFDKLPEYKGIYSSALFVSGQWDTVYNTSRSYTFTIRLNKSAVLDAGYKYFFETLINGITTYHDAYADPYTLWNIVSLDTWDTTASSVSTRSWTATSINSSNTSDFNSYGQYINRARLWSLDLRNSTTSYSFNRLRFTFSVSTSATQYYQHGILSMYLSNFVRYIYNEDFGGWDFVGPPSPPFTPSPDLLDPDSVLNGSTINSNANNIFNSSNNIYNSLDIHSAALFVQELYSVYLFPTVVSILVTLSLGFLVIKSFLGRD